VLHLVAGNLYGGIERMLVCMAKYSSFYRGMIPSFAVCFDGRLAEELNGMGHKVAVFGKVSFRNPLSLFRVRRRLKGHLEENNFDWVVCHGSWAHGLAGKVVHKSQSKLVHMIHGIPDHFSLHDKWARSIVPDLVLANSRASISVAQKMFPGISVKVTYPPSDIVPNPDIEGLRAKWRRVHGVSGDQFAILGASRMEYGKGIDILVDALGHIKHDPRWVCWIAGAAQRDSDQKYFDSVRTKAIEVGVDGRIRWLGHVQDMLGHFAAADLYCQPNRLPESFGLTFIEAQAMGCPVLTTATGGATESVSNRSPNILLEKACPHLLSKALVSCIADGCSKAR